MAPKRKRALWIIGGIVLLLIVITVIFKKDDQGTRVSTEIVKTRTISEIVSANGKIQPEYEVKISADVSGEIIEMAVKEGDSVTRGQLLLRINPDLYETQMSQLSANLDNGRAALAGNEAQKESMLAAMQQAQSEYDRMKKLRDQKVISEQEFEQVRLKLETAKANYKAAEKNVLASRYTVKSLAASLEQGRKNLGRTSIFAPVSGIVTNLVSEKGERVVGTAQMAGTEIMRISNLGSMEVEVNVNENDIMRVKNGDSADIKVDAWPDRIFKGVVTEIANSARFEATSAMVDQATNYIVKVRILPGSYRDLAGSNKQPFRSGMTATVDIRTVTKKNVIAVPIASVTTREPGNQTEKTNKGNAENTEKGNSENEITRTWVFLYDKGKAKAVEVKTGIQDINYFEVTSGIRPGDEVISAPGMAVARKLNNGDKVQKVDKSRVFESKP